MGGNKNNFRLSQILQRSYIKKKSVANKTNRVGAPK